MNPAPPYLREIPEHWRETLGTLMNLSLTNPERLPWAALLRQAWYNNLFLSFIALSNILPFITFHYLSGPCQLGSISTYIKLFPITQTVVGLRYRFHASFMVLAIRCLKSLVNALNVNTSLDIKYEHLILMNNNRYWTNFTSTIITKLVRYIPDDNQTMSKLPSADPIDYQHSSYLNV